MSKKQGELKPESISFWEEDSAEPNVKKTPAKQAKMKNGKNKDSRNRHTERFALDFFFSKSKKSSKKKSG